MSKIIPILCLIGAIAGAVMGVLAFIFVLLCGTVPALLGLAVFAVPLLVCATVTVGVTTLTNFIFMKDRLCRIGFFIGLFSVALVIGSYAALLVI